MKTLPESKEAEIMVLSSMFMSADSLSIACDALDVSDFYYPEHEIVFNTLKDFYKRERVASLQLVYEELKRSGEINKIGGIGELMSLEGYAGIGTDTAAYCEIVKDKAISRRAIYVFTGALNTFQKDPKDPSFDLEIFQKKLFDINTSRSEKSAEKLKDSLEKDGIEKNLQESYKYFTDTGFPYSYLKGVNTGFSELDKTIGGLSNSNLVILAARPAMGKTAFALNIAENICFDQKKPTVFFTLEMNSEQLTYRLITSQTSIQTDNLKTGTLNPLEFHKASTCINMMKQSELFLNDQPGVRINQLKARARRLKEVHNIAVIIIDYLQLITGSSKMERLQEVSEISRELKNLARELDIPVLCLAQLSRKVEDRPDHRPVMSDLRESGTIEQDADVVLMLTRPEYYQPGVEKGKATLIIAKNRHGGTGDIHLKFDKEIGKFTSDFRNF